MVRVIDVPVATLVADSVKLTVGALSVIVLVALELWPVNPKLSVALTYTWNVAVGVLPVEA
jgi:hypothetical protein